MPLNGFPKEMFKAAMPFLAHYGHLSEEELLRFIRTWKSWHTLPSEWSRSGPKGLKPDQLFNLWLRVHVFAQQNRCVFSDGKINVRVACRKMVGRNGYEFAIGFKRVESTIAAPGDNRSDEPPMPRWEPIYFKVKTAGRLERLFYEATEFRSRSNQERWDSVLTTALEIAKAAAERQVVASRPNFS